MWWRMDFTAAGFICAGEGCGGAWIADAVPGVIIWGYVVAAGRDMADCWVPPTGS